MQENDLEKFGDFLDEIAEIYGKTLSDRVKYTYFCDLKKYTPSQLSLAAKKHRIDPKHGSFMPKAADFVRHLEIGEQEIEEKAARIWGVLTQENGGKISTIGAYVDEILFDDPAVVQVINDMGGWVKLCRSQMKDLKFMARDFIKRYLRAIQSPISGGDVSLHGLPSGGRIRHVEAIKFDDDISVSTTNLSIVKK